MSSTRQIYGILMLLLSLPLISRGFTGHGLSKAMSFRGASHTLRDMTSNPNESPEQEPKNFPDKYVKYQNYIETNEKMFRKLQRYYREHTVPEEIGFLMWEWEFEHDILENRERLHLLQNDDAQLALCQRKAKEYRTGLLIALAAVDTKTFQFLQKLSARLLASKDPRKRLEKCFQLELSDTDENQKCRHIKKMRKEQEEKLNKFWNAELSFKDHVAYLAKLIRVEQVTNPKNSELPKLKHELTELLRPYGDLQAEFVDLITSEYE